MNWKLKHRVISEVRWYSLQTWQVLKTCQVFIHALDPLLEIVLRHWKTLVRHWKMVVRHWKMILRHTERGRLINRFRESEKHKKGCINSNLLIQPHSYYTFVHFKRYIPIAKVGFELNLVWSSHWQIIRKDQWNKRHCAEVCRRYWHLAIENQYQYFQQ